MLKPQLRNYSGISWVRMCKWGMSHTGLPIIAKTRMGYMAEFCTQRSHFSYVRKGSFEFFGFEVWCWVSIFSDSDSLVIPTLHKCSKATSSVMLLRQILSWLSFFCSEMEEKGQRYTLPNLTVKMHHRLWKFYALINGKAVPQRSACGKHLGSQGAIWSCSNLRIEEEKQSVISKLCSH